MTTMTGVAYARFSHKAAEDKVVTLTSQLEDERKRAKNDGCSIVAEFADDGFSGWKKGTRRPGWDDMLEYIENNSVDRIYTRETDRTSRQILQTAMLLEFCIKHGVTLVEGGNVTAHDDEDAHDMRMMKATFDKRYSSSISKKTKNAREKGALAGRPHPGRRPFGYAKDRVHLDPKEAKAYRELFKRVIAGEALNAISRDWAKRGILNRSGRPFTTHSLKQLLAQPRAVGERVHRGEVIGKGHWEPIVTKAVQRRALDAREAVRRKSPLRLVGADRSPRMLSSMMTCAECDGPMRVRYNNHPTQKAQYSCNPALRDSCGHVHVQAVHVEVEVEKRFLALLRKPSTLTAIKKLRKKGDGAGAILDEIDRLQTELDSGAAAWGAGDISLSEWKLARPAIQKRLDVAKAHLERVSEVPALLSISPQTILDKWDGKNTSLDQQRQWLSAFINTVSVSSVGNGGANRGGGINPDRIFIDWRI